MQDKEPSERSAVDACYAGIDVGKDWLDICVLPAGDTLRAANDAAGIRKLKRWLAGRAPAGVALEATGKWHRQVHRSLHASGLRVAVADPWRVRQFAKAAGILAKTDRLDALVLARFAAVMAPAIRPPTPEALEELAELAGARDAAVVELVALKNRLATATTPFLRRALIRRAAALDRHIASLQSECLKRVHADQGMAARYAILISIPAIGPIAAVTLIAFLRELGACSAKQIAMLAGLAPIANDSGKQQRVRMLGGGRAKPRRVLFLAALSAARCNPQLKTLFRRLAEAGKPSKLALIAIARKLVVLANTLIAENRPWRALPPNTA